MKENMRSRKGVALAEVVIALVVITIISVATLSVMFSSVQIENKTIVAMDVRNQAENAIECFRFAKGDQKAFFDCLVKIAEGENCNYEIEDTEFVLDMGGYEIKIKITGEMTGFKFAAAYENEIEDPFYDFEFPKSSENTNARGNAQ